MGLKQGINRNEEQRFRLEDMIPSDDVVRVFDAYVSSLDISSYGFTSRGSKKTGRDAYSISTLLRIILYGTYKGIHSGRKLAEATSYDLRFMWLVSGQSPCHKTISDFKSSSPASIKSLFKSCVAVLKSWELIEGKLLAVDGTKIVADNSKKHNYSKKKIERHQKYISDKLLNLASLKELCSEPSDLEKLENTISIYKERAANYKKLETALLESGDTQISTVDVEARAFSSLVKEVQIGYNVQTAVDATNNMLVAYEVTNKIDAHALYSISDQARKQVGQHGITVLGDKGYHTGSELSKCAKNDITTYVSIPKKSAGNKPPAYRKDKFVFDKKSNTYTCPMGIILETNGKWYKSKNRKGDKSFLLQKFYAPYINCNDCPAKQICAGIGISKRKSNNGRLIKRTEYDSIIEENAARMAANPDLYKRRKAIVEHPFGTIKHHRRLSHFLFRGITKVSGEIGLAYTAYNIGRATNILGAKEIIAKLKEIIISFAIIIGGIRTFFSYFFYLESNPEIIDNNFNCRERSYNRLLEPILFNHNMIK